MALRSPSDVLSLRPSPAEDIAQCSVESPVMDGIESPVLSRKRQLSTEEEPANKAPKTSGSFNATSVSNDVTASPSMVLRTLEHYITTNLSAFDTSIHDPTWKLSEADKVVLQYLREDFTTAFDKLNDHVKELTKIWEEGADTALRLHDDTLQGPDGSSEVSPQTAEAADPTIRNSLMSILGFTSIQNYLKTGSVHAAGTGQQDPVGISTRKVMDAQPFIAGQGYMNPQANPQRAGVLAGNTEQSVWTRADHGTSSMTASKSCPAPAPQRPLAVEQDADAFLQTLGNDFTSRETMRRRPCGRDVVLMSTSGNEVPHSLTPLGGHFHQPDGQSNPPNQSNALPMTESFRGRELGYYPDPRGPLSSNPAPYPAAYYKQRYGQRYGQREHIYMHEANHKSEEPIGIAPQPSGYTVPSNYRTEHTQQGDCVRDRREIEQGITPSIENSRHIMPGKHDSNVYRRENRSRESPRRSTHRSHRSEYPRNADTASSSSKPTSSAPTVLSKIFDKICPFALLDKQCPRDVKGHRNFPCRAQKICNQGNRCEHRECKLSHVKKTCKGYVHNGKCEVGRMCNLGHDYLWERREVADRARAHEKATPFFSNAGQKRGSGDPFDSSCGRVGCGGRDGYLS